MPVSKYRDDPYLKYARETVHPLRGKPGVCEKTIAARMNEDYENLSNWIQGWRPMTPARVVGFTRASENPMMLEAMAQDCGYQLVPLPSGEDVGVESIPRVIEEFAGLVRVACEAMRDGTITADEVAEVRRRALVAIRAEYQLVVEMDNRVAARRPALFERTKSLAAAESSPGAGLDVSPTSTAPTTTCVPPQAQIGQPPVLQSRSQKAVKPRHRVCGECLEEKGIRAFRSGESIRRECESISIVRNINKR